MNLVNLILITATVMSRSCGKKVCTINSSLRIKNCRIGLFLSKMKEIIAVAQPEEK